MPVETDFHIVLSCAAHPDTTELPDNILSAMNLLLPDNFAEVAVFKKFSFFLHCIIFFPVNG